MIPSLRLSHQIIFVNQLNAEFLYIYIFFYLCFIENMLKSLSKCLIYVLIASFKNEAEKKNEAEEEYSNACMRFKKIK